MADEHKPEGDDQFLSRLWLAYGHFLTVRRGQGTSQAAIASAVERRGGFRVRQDDVSRWLRGVGRPEYEELPAVAFVFGVRHHWLAFNEGPMLATNADPELIARDRLASETPAKKRRRGA